MNPLCFVLMPFGKKTFQNEIEIDFDAIYNDLIQPAIQEAGLEPIRADEEKTDGIIHKPMFERLVLCDYAVADLTTANANVFYELGVRHAVKPFSTIMIFANSMRLPFDVGLLRALPYQLDDKGKLIDLENDLKMLKEKIINARQEKTKDSPLYQLLEDYPNISHEKTDVFRKMVNYSKEVKEQLFKARTHEDENQRLEKITKIEQEIGKIEEKEAGIIIDLFLSYRSLGSREGFQKMVDLIEKMSPILQQTVMVREQYAFALNRLNKKEEAEKVLLDLIKNRGGSSETYGILGRIYKDQWEAAYKDNKKLSAAGYLKKAIDTYMKGFNMDWRDAYPGVNAVTLMAIAQPEDTRWKEIYPVVQYACNQKMKGGSPDYWDYATMLELKTIKKEWEQAAEYLGSALANVREKWEPETTAKNIRYIKESREARNENADNENEIIEALLGKK